MQVRPFCLQHSKTFDISHAFLQVTIAELSTLKQVRFFGPPCKISAEWQNIMCTIMFILTRLQSAKFFKMLHWLNIYFIRLQNEIKQTLKNIKHWVKNPKKSLCGKLFSIFLNVIDNILGCFWILPLCFYWVELRSPCGTTVSVDVLELWSLLQPRVFAVCAGWHDMHELHGVQCGRQGRTFGRRTRLSCGWGIRQPNVLSPVHGQQGMRSS